MKVGKERERVRDSEKVRLTVKKREKRENKKESLNHLAEAEVAQASEANLRCSLQLELEVNSRPEREENE